MPVGQLSETAREIEKRSICGFDHGTVRDSAFVFEPPFTASKQGANESVSILVLRAGIPLNVRLGLGELQPPINHCVRLRRQAQGDGPVDGEGGNDGMPKGFRLRPETRGRGVKNLCFSIS